MHIDVHTETILRNQASAGLWLVRAWFKNGPVLSRLVCGGTTVSTIDEVV